MNEMSMKNANSYKRVTQNIDFKKLDTFFFEFF